MLALIRRPALRWWLGVIVAMTVGVVIRTVYVLVVIRHVPPGLDAVWYTLEGGSIRAGTGYVVPTSLFHPPVKPTAGFPPLYPLYQAIWQSAFGNGAQSVRLAGLVPGSATVMTAAVLARRVGGPLVGLVAALLVALDPVLIAVDGSSMSENLSVLLVTAAVLVAFVLATDGFSLPRMLALGLLCGLGALTRQDLVLLVPVLLLPAAALARSRPWRTRLMGAAAGLAVVAVVLVPWSVRNHERLGTWSTSTLSASSALAGANCAQTYSGRSIGSWEFACVAAAQDPNLGEAAQASHYEHVAVHYARSHLGRLPLVAVARVARVWGFWKPSDQLPREAVESRRYGWQALAWPVRILLVLVGGAGLVVAVRRQRSGWPLAVPIVVATVSAVIGHGNPRFSAIADPVLAVGAALVLVGAFDRWRGARSQAAAEAVV